MAQRPPSNNIFGAQGEHDVFAPTQSRRGGTAPAGPPSARPFATAEAGDSFPQAEDFHLIPRNKAVTDKPGVEGFDAAIYSSNRAQNKLNMDESKARNYAGGGVVVRDMDPAAAYASTKELHLLHHNRELPDKIGAAGSFDAEAYRQQLASNLKVQQETGAKAAGGCPFATDDSAELRAAQWQRADYRAKAKGRAMADKVGSGRTFDAELYSSNRAQLKESQAAASQRNFVGGGDILAFVP